MRFHISRFAVLMCFLLGGASLCFGEAYTIYDLGSDEGHTISGITSAGTVVLTSDICAGNLSVCYSAFDPDTDAKSGLSSLAAAGSFDNGAACTPKGVAGAAQDTISHSVCNGSTQAFSGYMYYDSVADCPPAESVCALNKGMYRGLFVDTVGGYLDTWADQIFVNSDGDIAWSDGVSEENFEAVPVTPEPSTIVLVGTGLLAAFAMKRKMGRTAA